MSLYLWQYCEVEIYFDMATFISYTVFMLYLFKSFYFELYLYIYKLSELKITRRMDIIQKKMNLKTLISVLRETKKHKNKKTIIKKRRN